MATTNGRPGRVAAVLAVTFLTLACARLGAAEGPKKAGSDANPEDEALRKRALALNDITGTDPVKGEITALRKDPDGTKRLLAVAGRMAKEKDQPFNVNATFILASTARMLKDFDAAETFYRLNLSQAIKMGSDQKISQAFEWLIQVLAARGKYTDCEKLCKEVLDNEGLDDERVKAFVLRRLILVLAKLGQFEKAHDLVDKLIKASPDNWDNLEVKGDVLRDEGKPGEAAKYYEDALEKVKSNETLAKEFKKEQEALVADFRYKLSGVYVDANEVDKAADHLKGLLEKDPDNPTYNNDLGYIWADHDKNLAESEKLVRKALDEDRKQRHKNNPDLTPDEDKDNPAFLDSLGWVLFKQKKYEEAKPYLQQAVEQEAGKHAEIYDHLGDVLMALGDKAGAVAAWKKGVEVAGITPREKERKAEVEKKLKAKQ